MAKGSTVDTLFLYALYAFMAYGLFMFWSNFGSKSYNTGRTFCEKAGGAIYDVGADVYNTYGIANWRFRDRDPMQRN